MTLRLAVLGSPVAYSRSPQIHTAAIRHVGLDATYEARDVDDAGMVGQAELAHDGLLFGANITMPHKALAARLATRLSPLAERLGSVNTWVTEGRDIVGHSTDGAGVRYAWGHAGLPDGAVVVVLGSGGAAVAAAAELAASHRVVISARRQEAASEAAARAGVGTAEWCAIPDGAAVVNATPLGMDGEALPCENLGSAAGYLEMAYTAGPTPTEIHLTSLGIPVASGTDMLLGQAMASFELWFGRSAPEAVMRAAVNDSSA